MARRANSLRQDNSLDEQTLEDEVDISKVIDNAAHRESGASIEFEDLRQELWIFYLEKKDMVEHDKQMASLIGKTARSVARRERIDYMYFSGAFIYTPSMVRTLLADAVWCEVEEAFDIEGRVDVTAALKKQSQRAQGLLYARFALGEKPEGDSDDRKVIDRAIDSITHELNTHSTGERIDESFVLDPSSTGGTAF